MKALFRSIYFCVLLCSAAASFGAEAVVRIPMVTKDLIYLPDLNRIYASVPASAANQANSLVSVGQGRQPLPIPAPGDPGLMALRSAREIYVAKNNPARIDLISIPSGAVLSSIPLPADSKVRDLAPMPGAPDVLAVTRGLSQSASTWLYDHGTLRSSNANVQSFTWSADGLFVFGRASTNSYALHRLTARPESGFGANGSIALASAFGDLEYKDDALYLDSGEVLNPSNFAFIRSFPGVRYDSSMALSLDGQEIAFLSHNGLVWTLEVFDRTAGIRVSRFETSNYSSTFPSRLIAYGSRNYAFRTDNEVILVPRMSAVDVGVSQSLSPETTAQNQPVTYTITAMNRTGTATEVEVETQLDGVPYSVQKLIRSTGEAKVTNSMFLWRVGTLASGASATLEIGIIPRGYGTLTGSVNIVSTQADTDAANNRTRLTPTRVQIPENEPFVPFTASLQGMGYDPVSGKVIIIGPTFRDLTYIDPFTASSERTIRLPERLGPQLAVASNGDVYVAMENSGQVQQVRADGTIGSRFYFTTPSGSLLQIIPVPGRPNELILRTSTAVSLFRNGVRIPNWLPPGEFVLSPSGTEGYRVNAQTGTFSKVALGPNGFTVLTETSVPGVRPGRLSYAAGKILTLGGSIIDAASGTLAGLVPHLQNVAQVVANEADGRVYTFWHDTVVWYLSAYDASTLDLRRRWPIPGLHANPDPLISIGPNRLAVRAGSQQYFFIYPEQFPNPDVSLSQEVVGEGAMGTTTNFSATIRVDSIGPVTATNVQVTIQGENLASFSAVPSSGTLAFNGAGLEWTIGNLPSGAFVTLQLQAAPTQPGPYRLTSTARANPLEVNGENNTETFFGMNRQAFSPPVTQFTLGAIDFAWESASSNFVLAFPAGRIHTAPALLNYHPDSGQFSNPSPLAFAPISLTEQKGNNRVLVAGDSPLKVLRYDPVTESGETIVTSIATPVARIINIPGPTNLWLLPFANSSGTAVIADGEPMPSFVESGHYEASSLGNIYNSIGGPTGIRWLALGANGLELRGTAPGSPGHGPFAVLGDRLFFANGPVVKGDTGEVIGTIPPGQQPFITADPGNNLVFLLSHDYVQWTVRVYDGSNLSLLARINVNGLTDVPVKLAPWGHRGAAFLTRSGQFYIVQVAPIEAPLSLTMDPLAWAMVVTNQSRLNFRISNPSPITARNVNFQVEVPDAFTFIAAHAGTILCTFTNGVASCFIPEVPGDTVLSATLDFVPRFTGEFPIVATLISLETPDPSTEDNEVSTSIEIVEPPLFMLTDVVLREGQNTAIAGRLDFPVSHLVSVRANWELLTASAADFFTRPALVWNFPPGRTSAVMTVQAKTDGILEGDEFFEFIFTESRGARLDRPSALHRIIDADAPGLFAPDVEWNENDAPETQIQVPVHLSFPLGVPSRVRYSTVSATALPGQDYFHQEGTIEFAPGAISNSIPLTVIGNDSAEATRSFGIVFFDAENSNIIKDYVTVLIRDDDGGATAGLLMMSSARTADGQFQVSFPSQLRKKYVLEYSSLLQPGDWKAADGAIDGTGHTVFRSIQLNGKTNAYFRLREMQ